MKIFLGSDVEVTMQGSIFSRLRCAPVGGVIVPLKVSDLDTGDVLARLKVQVSGLGSTFLGRLVLLSNESTLSLHRGNDLSARGRDLRNLVARAAAAAPFTHRCAIPVSKGLR